MNIEVANRLVNLRKQNNLSQEQLAEKIGVSRQAVSKWERSEASPDTDNLIMLARLYNVSLDELLRTDDEIPDYSETDENKNEESSNEAAAFNNENDYGQSENNENCFYGDNGEKVKVGKNGIHVEDGKDKVHIDWRGIHVEDGEDFVHVGWDGIHVQEKHGDNVHIDHGGVFVNGERKHFKDHHHCGKKPRMSAKLILLTTLPFTILIIAAYLFTGFYFNDWSKNWLMFLAIPIFDGIVAAIAHRKINMLPYPIACITGYLCAGIFAGMWHPTWIVLLTIPMVSGLISAIKHKNICRFPYPVLTVAVYLTVGFMYGMWHPMWVVFVTIPVYYMIGHAINNIRKEKRAKQNSDVVFDDITVE